MDKRVATIIISRLSRPLAIGVVDVITVGAMVVRTALVDKRVATTIVTRLSIPLAVVARVAISMESLGGSVIVAGGMSIAITVSGLGISVPLAIVARVAISSSQTLGASVDRAGATIGMVGNSAIAIAGLSLGLPLAVASNVVSVGVVGRAVAIAMVSLGHIHRGGAIAAIARLGLSLPLAIIATIAVSSVESLRGSVAVAHSRVGMDSHAIAISGLGLSLPLAIIATIAVSSITTMESLGGSVGITGGMTIAIAVSRLGSSEAGERENDRKRFNCHGVDTKLSQFAMCPMYYALITL